MSDCFKSLEKNLWLMYSYAIEINDKWLEGEASKGIYNLYEGKEEAFFL